MLRGDTVDHLGDEHGLADAGTTEQADLAALGVRSQQVHHLDAGLKHLGGRGLVFEARGVSVDGPFLLGADVAELVDISRKTRWVNAIWPEAVIQGRIAGTNMAGRRMSYRGSLSRNVLRILNLDVMTMGQVNPPDTSEYDVISTGGPGRKA